jgi:hypothetical protein
MKTFFIINIIETVTISKEERERRAREEERQRQEKERRYEEEMRIWRKERAEERKRREREKREKRKELIKKTKPIIKKYFEIGTMKKITEKNLLRKKISGCVEEIGESIERKKWFSNKNLDTRFILTIIINPEYDILSDDETINKDFFKFELLIEQIKNGLLFENLPFNCVFIEILFDIDFIGRRYKLSNEIIDKLNYYSNDKQYKFI